MLAMGEVGSAGSLPSNLTIEESANPISLNLPDFTTDSYKDAYS